MRIYCRRQVAESLDEFTHNDLASHRGSIAEALDLTRSAPADLFGLAGQKGRLAAGADADLMIFDPHHVWSFDAADIRAKCGWSAYSGWMFTGRTVMTLRCGEVVYDAATATFGAPTGRWLDVAPAQIGAAA